MSTTPKTEAQAKFLKASLWLSFPVVWFVLYFSYAPIFEGRSWFSHDELTRIHAPENWQVGEYKTCTTINGNGAGAPEQSKSRQTINCGAEATSQPIGDGKLLKVRFSGETYLVRQDVTAILAWNCRKNPPGPDPLLTCEHAPQESANR